MANERLRIGELLIEAGVLNHAKLREALDLQRASPRPLGRILVEAGLISEPHLVQALSRQLAIPWVSLWHVDVPPELAALLAREEAERHRVLPIYVRNVAGEHSSLFAAIDDPTNQAALEFMESKAGMPVKPMIAGPTDLSNAIKTVYGDEDEDVEDEPAPLPPPAPIPLRRISSVPPPPPPPLRRKTSDAHAAADEAPAAGGDREATVRAPTSIEESASGPVPPPPEVAIESALAEMEAAQRGVPAEDAVAPPGPPPEEPVEPERARVRPRLRRAIAFTFLDGTTLSLGVADAVERPEADDVSIAALVAALRRHADDPAYPAPMGPRGAHRVLAAVIDILARKRLLTEQELSEALKEAGR